MAQLDRAWQHPCAPGGRWLESWAEVGAVVTGMERQWYHVSLTRFPGGWRATFIRRRPLEAALTRSGAELPP
ncbi:MAG TPA: hypothetical protein VLG10_07685 [Methylomirabilota bacterium]|nr:hypothetical protein [Methylomirabilota bacterium]